MKANFEELIKEVTSFLKDEVKTDTIIGKEFKLGEFSCVPVMAIGLGFGGGGGGGTDTKKEMDGEGSGAGAGVGLAPIGFLVARGDKIEFISSSKPGVLSSAFEKLPDLLSKFFESRKEKVSAN